MRTASTLTLAVGLALYSLVPLAARGPRDLPTLVTAKQAHDLAADEASRSYPVALNGVITYYDGITDADSDFFFIHDATGSIFVRCPKNGKSWMQAGDVVKLTGVSQPGQYAPIVKGLKVELAGHSRLPEADPSTVSRMLTGAEDAKWLQLKGVVLGAEVLDRLRMMLEVQVDIGVVRVTVMNYGNLNASQIVDSSMLITGNCAPYFNSNRQLVGVRLFTPSASLIKVVRAAPAPFSLRTQSIASLMRYTPDQGDVHRVRVHGTVTLSLPDHLVIQEGEAGTIVEPAKPSKFQLGEEVDTVGVAAPGDYSSVMRRALVRPTGRYGLIPPVPVSATQVLSGSYDMRLIQVEGRLIGIKAEPFEQTLRISSKGALVEAVLKSESSQPSLSHLEEGSDLRLTGVCSVQVDHNRVPKAFQVLLRSRDDIVVTRYASWWSPLHTLYVLAGTLAATLIVVTWVLILRRRVSEQTEVIRRQLAEADKLKSRAEAASDAKSIFWRI